MTDRTVRPPDWQHLNLNAQSSVVGIFDDKDSSELAVDKLKEQGFKGSDISVKVPEKAYIEMPEFERANKATEGAATGATTGAVIGGAFGWLVGIGAFSLTSAAPFLAAGPLMSAIAGIGIGGTIGGLCGALLGFFIPEFATKKDKPAFTGKGILLSIHCNDSDWINRAKKLLEVSGAHDIASMYEA